MHAVCCQILYCCTVLLEFEESIYIYNEASNTEELTQGIPAQDYRYFCCIRVNAQLQLSQLLVKFITTVNEQQ